MIEYHYKTDFRLENEIWYSDWINRVVSSEGFEIDAISYIFCDDAYLLELNLKHLGHDTLTDIITFDYSENRDLSGDIFISHERVVENALDYKVATDEEVRRVMAHGVLHMMGYKDKTEKEAKLMRSKEGEKMKMFHVEQRS